MSRSIRERLGIDKDDFVFMFLLGTLLFILLISAFMPFVSENPVLSAVTLGFVLILASSVYLLKNYLDVRKLEAQPSAEELLKKQYIKNENIDIQDYEEEYDELKEIEKET